MSAMNIWKRKLIAFLHDPPEKSYDYSKRHEQRADIYARALGFDEAQWPSKNPDWTASAADRFVFPKGGNNVSLGGGVEFRHPLSGKISGLSFPDQATAETCIADTLPSFKDLEDPDKFWLIWRLWMEYAAEHRDNRGKGAPAIPYLPADTRIPDGTIWHHMAVTSALEATRADADQKNLFKPAFFLFKLGGVQDFISQARSTRDLWSGSYLFSWMMAHAIKAISDKYGPDCLVFPSLRGQPLIDWLYQDTLKKAKYDEHSYWESKRLDKSQDLVLTSNLPNDFLAVVPADFDPKIVADVFDYDNEQSEWRKICDACRFALRIEGKQNETWHFQCSHFWQKSWQIWPWQDVGSTLRLSSDLPSDVPKRLVCAKKVAEAIPDKDGRCYPLNTGWAWSALYQLLVHRLDARRQTRDFGSWRGVDKAVKDDYSGKEEEVIVANKDWVNGLMPDLQHLFRKDKEALGAANCIKRIWHKTYLEKEKKLIRAKLSFDSVPAIAASSWMSKVLGAMSQEHSAYQAFLDFRKAVGQCEELLEFALPSSDEDSKWFEKADASIYHASFWENLERVGGNNAHMARDAKNALQKLIKETNVGAPSKYYAVLALDGDRMGKWVSGDNAPKVRDVITSEAVEYFKNKVNIHDVEKWLDGPRPVSPSYHLQFSEALANFGLYCARRIVDHHHGQLIYSGGDDVVAMLPADEAIDCALGLRMAFQGSQKLADRYPDMFLKCPEGFIYLKDGDWNNGARRDAEPSWPLLVPGPAATVSVGISIGHIKEPLQDMVNEAHEAEKRAKANPIKRVRGDNGMEEKSTDGWGRDALGITLFKRSGETIKWGARFDSKALELLKFMKDNYRQPKDDPHKVMPVSGRFPYRMAELLRKYEPVEALTAELLKVVQKEVVWVISRQCNYELQSDLEVHCNNLLREMLSFKVESDGKESEAPRPLKDFYNLFAIEAFIARQEE